MRFVSARDLPIHLIYVENHWLDFSFRWPTFVNATPDLAGNLPSCRIIQVDTVRVNCYIECVAM